MIVHSLKRRELILMLIFLIMLCGFMIVKPPAGRAEQSIFSTWEGFETDKCASIWLIKRFIDEKAIIKFFPKGEGIKEGIPFDTPDAELRRYHNMSTYESFLRQYKLKDPKLIYIGRIIHDIEVNTWEKKVLDETLIVQDAVNKIILDSKNSDEVIRKSYEYFDFLYKSCTVSELSSKKCTAIIANYGKNSYPLSKPQIYPFVPYPEN